MPPAVSLLPQLPDALMTFSRLLAWRELPDKVSVQAVSIKQVNDWDKYGP